MIPSSTPEALLPKASFDGYIRLTFDTFTRLTFRHKLAWEDFDLKHEFRDDFFPVCRAGYCEWATGGSNAISVGWAWFAGSDMEMFIAPGHVNSNVMFVTPKHYDLGASKTSELLRAWLSSHPWQPGRILMSPEAGLQRCAPPQHDADRAKSTVEPYSYMKL